MHNPALRQEPRYEPAAVIPLKQETSLLDWLEGNGRLIAREQKVDRNLPGDDPEISELMDVDDAAFDEDNDDDDDDDDDDMD